MITNRITITLIVFILSPIAATLAQSDEKWDLMLIREDKVYPSMTDEYETALIELRDLLETKKEKQFHYFTHLQDDYLFTHVTPINHWKDLHKGLHSFVAKQVKDPELDLILDYLYEAIESYSYYIVQYRPELSYVPEGDDWGEGSPYRKWSYYHFQPGSEEEVEQVLASWKQMYQAKGIKTGYRVFAGFLGIEQPTYLLTTWAEDPLDYHENLQQVSEQMGEEGAVLWAKMMEYVQEAATVEGWYLAQYSYAPDLKMAE